MKSVLKQYADYYRQLINEPEKFESHAMPSGAYFLEDNSVLVIPSDEGDARYPYGSDGFNYWTYASGYIHANEGLFSPFLRATEGAEPKVAFFAGVEGQEDMFSLLSVPQLSFGDDGIERFTVFTKGGTYYVTLKDDLIFGIRTFVDVDRNIFFSCSVINESAAPTTVKFSSFINPFIKNALVENSTDRWFRQVEYYEQGSLGGFTIETYEERHLSGMATNYGILNRYMEDASLLVEKDVTTSRYGYVGGVRSSLHSAKALAKGAIEEKKVSSFTETAICADMLKLKVEDETRLDIRFAYTFEDDEAVALKNEEIAASDIDERFAKVSHNESVVSDGMAFTFDVTKEEGKALKLNGPVFNGFMEHLKKQVAFCSEIKGYIQLSSFSLIGIRDVFQAIEGYLFWQPEASKAKMLEAFDFLNPEGRFPRQYSLPVDENSAPAMDLRPFIDQGVWVISTIATYLKQTKDYSILDEVCGYYDFVDEHKHIARKNEMKDSVLEHMLKVMNYLLTNRDHDKTKCVLALYGDWNDALDGLGKSQDPNKAYGTGVSVMATLQVYQNLTEMVEILNRVDSEKYASVVTEYQLAQKEIRNGLFEYALTDDRILHGWGDEMSYLVGSTNDPDGLSRDGLTSNAFWILSNLYRDSIDAPYDNELSPEAVKEIILNAYDRLDSKYGLKTFHPHFEKGTHGVGRIPNLPEGTAENGATYIHASMFGVMSLFAMGASKTAWEQLAKLLPVTHDKVSVSPYVAPNSYGYNESLGIDGESMADWQTGSSNVLLKTIIRYVFGYEPDFDGLMIQPSKCQPFECIGIAMNYKGRDLKLTVKNMNDCKGNDKAYTRQFIVNGETMKGQYDKVMDMERLYLTDAFLNTLDASQPIIIEVVDKN